MTQNKSKQTAFLRFSLEFLCVFFKYSFNANTTHNCIFKMNIIALFLHILWDRKCKELLIPVSEAETVVCFCFQMVPYWDLPPNSPRKEDCVLARVYMLHCVGEHTDMKHRKPTSLAHRDWLPLNSTPRDPAYKRTKLNFQICMTILDALMLTFIFPNKTKFKNKIKNKSCCCCCYYLRKL